MISLSIRRTLFAPDSETARVTGITIPDWDAIDELRLLTAVDYYTDAAFNERQLAALLPELRLWETYERSRDDHEDRLAKIGEIRAALVRANKDQRYAVFLGL